jgi:hypothetical protein
LSVALLFLSLLISVGGLAWKALLYGLLGEEGATHRKIGVISILAYLFLSSVPSCWWARSYCRRSCLLSRRLENYIRLRDAIHSNNRPESKSKRCPNLRAPT